MDERDNQDGTTDSDYSVEPVGSVTFNSGETEQSITLHPATDDDVDDDGESVRLAGHIGEQPAHSGVSEGRHPTRPR